jgi:hypothetical protein
VEKRRLALCIPSKNPAYHHWTKEKEALLGTMPDRKLAKLLGVSLIALVAQRQRKHIRSIDARRAWTPAEEALLGTATDDEVARCLGRTTVAVCLRRRALRIAVFGAKRQARLRRKLNDQ